MCTYCIRDRVSYVGSDIQDRQLEREYYCMYTRADSCVDMYRLKTDPRFCFMVDVWQLQG